MKRSNAQNPQIMDLLISEAPQEQTVIFYYILGLATFTAGLTSTHY